MREPGGGARPRFVGTQGRSDARAGRCALFPADRTRDWHLQAGQPRPRPSLPPDATRPRSGRARRALPCLGSQPPPPLRRLGPACLHRKACSVVSDARLKLLCNLKQIALAPAVLALPTPRSPACIAHAWNAGARTRTKRGASTGREGGRSPSKKASLDSVIDRCDVPTRGSDPGRPGSTRPTRFCKLAGRPGPTRPANGGWVAVGG